MFFPLESQIHEPCSDPDVWSPEPAFTSRGASAVCPSVQLCCVCWENAGRLSLRRLPGRPSRPDASVSRGNLASAPPPTPLCVSPFLSCCPPLPCPRSPFFLFCFPPALSPSFIVLRGKPFLSSDHPLASFPLGRCGIALEQGPPPRRDRGVELPFASLFS